MHEELVVFLQTAHGSPVEEYTDLIRLVGHSVPQEFQLNTVARMHAPINREHRPSFLGSPHSDCTKVGFLAHWCSALAIDQPHSYAVLARG